MFLDFGDMLELLNDEDQSVVDCCVPEYESLWFLDYTSDDDLEDSFLCEI